MKVTPSTVLCCHYAFYSVLPKFWGVRLLSSTSSVFLSIYIKEIEICFVMIPWVCNDRICITNNENKLCQIWKDILYFPWRNSSGLLIDIIKSSFVKTKTKNLLVLTVSCVLVNTLHQNDGTWSPLLFRRSPEVGVAERCGYPKWTFTQVKEQMANKQGKRKNNKKDTTKKSNGYVHIQYVEGIAEKATRILRRHDIATVMSPHATLRKLLVHPKDKRDPLSTTGCIYEVPCANCNESYVGEIGRRLETRLNEHKKETEKVEKSKRNFTRQTRKQSESEQSKSAIADHAVQHNHVINWKDAKILAKECVSDVRHIKEAIWIRRRAPNTMNRDEGPTI